VVLEPSHREHLLEALFRDDGFGVVVTAFPCRVRAVLVRVVTRMPHFMGLARLTTLRLVTALDGAQERRRVGFWPRALAVTLGTFGAFGALGRFGVRRVLGRVGRRAFR